MSTEIDKEELQSLGQMISEREVLEAQKAEIISPENLSQKYMESIHETFDRNISNIRGRVPGDKHKIWVNRGAPVDAKGTPLLDGSKAYRYMFPDMNMNSLGDEHYCTAAAMTSIDTVERKSGVQILDTIGFSYKNEDGEDVNISPYPSGHYSQKKDKMVSEGWNYRPDLLMAAFADTSYVSGAKINKSKLIARRDGTIAVDDVIDKKIKKAGVGIIQINEGCTIGNICKPENLVTDEKTGEKYYCCKRTDGTESYIKDGDILCLHVGSASNSASGYHTVMANIDKEGRITYTAGNSDRVGADLVKDFGSYPVAAFHTSEYAQAKISSFDEATRTKMAENLGYKDQLGKNQERIIALNQEISTQIEQSKAENRENPLSKLDNEISNMVNLGSEKNKNSIDAQDLLNTIQRDTQRASQMSENIESMVAEYVKNVSDKSLSISENVIEKTDISNSPQSSPKEMTENKTGINIASMINSNSGR